MLLISLILVLFFSVVSYLWLSDYGGKITDALAGEGCLDSIFHFLMFMIGFPGTILSKVIAAVIAAKKTQNHKNKMDKLREERTHSYCDNLSKFKSSDIFLVNKCEQQLGSYIRRCIREGCTTPISHNDASIVFLFTNHEVYRAEFSNIYDNDTDCISNYYRYKPYFSVLYSELGYETISSEMAIIAFADLIWQCLCKSFPELCIVILHEDPEGERFYGGKAVRVVVDISNKVRLLKKV